MNNQRRDKRDSHRSGDKAGKWTTQAQNHIDSPENKEHRQRKRAISIIKASARIETV
jgi:hypothetical protein